MLIVVCVYLTDIVDTVLKEDDLNDDGYLTYIEYVLARRRAESRHEKRDGKETESGEPNSVK